MSHAAVGRKQPNCILKRLRKGAYECDVYLVLYSRWISEGWDGPRESYRPWRVYKRASTLKPRAFLDAFRTRSEAHRFVAAELAGD